MLVFCASVAYGSMDRVRKFGVRFPPQVKITVYLISVVFYFHFKKFCKRWSNGLCGS